MSDFRVTELIEMLKIMPHGARVERHSGEGGGILLITSKNGKLAWEISKDGEFIKRGKSHE